MVIADSVALDNDAQHHRNNLNKSFVAPRRAFTNTRSEATVEAEVSRMIIVASPSGSKAPNSSCVPVTIDPCF